MNFIVFNFNPKRFHFLTEFRTKFETNFNVFKFNPKRFHFLAEVLRVVIQNLIAPLFFPSADFSTANEWKTFLMVNHKLKTERDTKEDEFYGA